MDVNLEQLRTLAAVVDEGTFDAASATLGISPSAVSQRIKALERAVGRVLLTRSKPVAVTGPGAVVLRLARTAVRASEDAATELDLATGAPTRLPIAVNADSLATWFLPALARLPARFAVTLDLHLDDQDRTEELFTSESVLAAVTSSPTPVAGCTVHPLGTMRYLPVAAADFAQARLPDGFRPEDLVRTPVVVFNRRDRLQHEFIRRMTGRAVRPPAHYIPSSQDFVRAIQLGLGWGLVPEDQLTGEAQGLTVLDPAAVVDVPLHWQVWRFPSPPLDALTAVVVRQARDTLRQAEDTGSG